jgi:hypothetical protein
MSQFFIFHIIASPSSSLLSIAVSLDFIYNSFISLNLCYVCKCSWIIVHWILQDQDSWSSLDVQNIPILPKFCKLLSREIYCKQMFNENWHLFYPNKRNMPSTSNHPGSMVLQHELDRFYVDTPWGVRKRWSSNCIFEFFNGTNVNVLLNSTFVL